MMLTGAALAASEIAMADGRLFWRVSGPNGESCNGGNGVVKPCSQGEPGPWSERVDYPKICESGWHATDDPIAWSGRRLALVEVDEVVACVGNKYVCHCLRELAVVDECVDVRLFVASHRPDLQGANLRDANLRDANLQGANLRGADLQGTNLQIADLLGARLQGANLRDANLRDAYLQGANLRGADLQGAYLQIADLPGARLQGASLRDAYLQGANLRGANLRGAYLKGADLQGAYLKGADLKGADLQGADLKGAMYTKTTLFPEPFLPWFSGMQEEVES